MMSKVDLDVFGCSEVFMKQLSRPGALLTVVDKDGRGNVMTIGWCHLGIVWGKQVCIVYVRPSRYSFTFLEQVGEFVVNVPGAELAKAVGVCGSKSGRDGDKFTLAGITAGKAKQVKAPIVDECLLHVECRVVHYNDMIKDHLEEGIVGSYFPGGDLHRIYYGEIVACYGDKEAIEKIKNRFSKK